jgi:hypothetical protein
MPASRNANSKLASLSLCLPTPLTKKRMLGTSELFWVNLLLVKALNYLLFTLTAAEMALRGLNELVNWQVSPFTSPRAFGGIFLEGFDFEYFA